MKCLGGGGFTLSESCREAGLYVQFNVTSRDVAVTYSFFHSNNGVMINVMVGLLSMVPPILGKF